MIKKPNFNKRPEGMGIVYNSQIQPGVFRFRVDVLFDLTVVERFRLSRRIFDSVKQFLEEKNHIKEEK